MTVSPSVPVKCDGCSAVYNIPTKNWSAKCVPCNKIVVAPLVPGYRYVSKDCKGVEVMSRYQQRLGKITCDRCNEKFVIGHKVAYTSCGQNFYYAERYVAPVKKEETVVADPEQNDKKQEDQVKDKNEEKVLSLEDSLKNWITDLNKGVEERVKAIRELAEKEAEKTKATEAEYEVEIAARDRKIQELQDALEGEDEMEKIIIKTHGENAVLEAKVYSLTKKLDATVFELQESYQLVNEKEKKINELQEALKFSRNQSIKLRATDIAQKKEIAAKDEQIAKMAELEKELEHAKINMEKMTIETRKLRTENKTFRTSIDVRAAENDVWKIEREKMIEYIGKMNTTVRELYQAKEEMDNTKLVNKQLNEFNVLSVRKINQLTMEKLELEEKLKHNEEM